jgi:hypothetical protein
MKTDGRGAHRHVWRAIGRPGELERHFLSDPTGAKRRAPKFDDLAFYAEHFDTVEINSTFTVPTPATSRGWADRTPPAFDSR